jgi:hypothetical protein
MPDVLGLLTEDLKVKPDNARTLANVVAQPAPGARSEHVVTPEVLSQAVTPNGFGRDVPAV